MNGLDDGYFVVSSGHMGGLDDGYFVVSSGHTGLGLDREALKQAIAARAFSPKPMLPPSISTGTGTGTGAGTGTNWMLWGGLAAAAALAGFVVLKRRKKA